MQWMWMCKETSCSQVGHVDKTSDPSLSYSVAKNSKNPLNNNLSVEGLGELYYGYTDPRNLGNLNKAFIIF